jgi:hypothetical protein
MLCRPNGSSFWASSSRTNMNWVMIALVPVVKPATRNGRSWTTTESPIDRPVRRANARSTSIPPGSRSATPSETTGRVAADVGSTPHTKPVNVRPWTTTVVISRRSGAADSTDGLSSTRRATAAPRNDVPRTRLFVPRCDTHAAIGRLST